MKKIIHFIVAASLVLHASFSVAQETTKPLVPLAKPSAVQYAYHEQERIMFVCLDPCTWQGREYDNHTTDLKTMKLPKLDVDQWCEAAKSWGAKELLFVAKHTGGFCWWQTETTDYSVKSIPWKNGKGDLVDEVAKACKRHGLKMGMYIYPGDDQWGANIGSGGRTKDPAKQKEYNKVLRKQWDEVLIRHKDVIIELWFDGNCYVPLGDVFKKHVGDRVVYLQGELANLRWVGNEKGITPYPAWNTLMRKDLETGVSTAVHGNPDGDVWGGVECNTTLYNHHWFWSKKKESRRVSLRELVRFYYQSAGRGATTLLNSTPNTDGLIPEKDMALYKAFGEELKRRFDHPLGETKGKGTVHTIHFPKPTVVNQFQIMEDYRQGHRIRKYVVEGRKPNGQWVTLNEGRAVGRKRIVMFKPEELTAVTLRITQHVNEPLVRDFKVYYVKGDNAYLYESQAGKLKEGDESSQWKICQRVESSFFKGDTATLSIDLSKYIKQPGQFMIRIDDLENAGVEVSEMNVIYDGHGVHEEVISTVNKNELYLLNRQAQVTEESKIELRIKLKRKASQKKGKVNISIKSVF